ncbi:MAG TPA: 4-(cytidine 5'-diphospho)-2-C-methyl-D-erythritol kinase [Jatrophihabitantaceae bacterium]|nr:4-(cytidine 5'-diphospho)-2-C-methyl-D-erythritol kinase [Jatrophihabitantaceae bacterium]
MSASVSSVRVRVPAKVNLQLGVGPLRVDGFHELVTVFHAVDIFDVITVRTADELSLTMRGEGAATLPNGPENLAWRAAELLAGQAGVAPSVSIEIDKAIPVAGGMAGGSADAAGTLLACATLWQLDDAGLPELAAQLGSDVAFGLVGGTALGTGRGEVLEPVPTAGSLHWVIAPAAFGISTARAYAELDRLRAAGALPPPQLDASALRTALESGSASRVAQALSNDLQPAALSLAPSLREVLDAGLTAGALAGIVSGSGPTCAFLCADAAAAADVARRFGAQRAVVATGPAPGATVLT